MVCKEWGFKEGIKKIDDFGFLLIKNFIKKEKRYFVEWL